jgi:phosphopantothenoylcysteine decarboxylase
VPFPLPAPSSLCSQTCIVRAWDWGKPLLLAPAMNTAMWLHPLTAQQLQTVSSWGEGSVEIISPIVKLLACGDRGEGAMEEVEAIARRVQHSLSTRSSTQHQLQPHFEEGSRDEEGEG